MQLTRVGICVLNWENYPDTESCILALLALPELRDEDLDVYMVVIDNGSKDDSFSKLEALIASELSTNIYLVKTTENRGYAAGNNAGIRYALENLPPDYVWILNNDTVPQPGSLRALVTCAQLDQSIGVWGSTVLNGDGSTQCAGGCYYNSWLGTMRPALPKNGSGDESSCLDRQLDYIYGAAMLISIETIRDYGLLSEDYFLYYEELDYAERIKNKKGMQWCSQSEVTHLNDGSSKKDNKERGVFEYHSILSLLIFTSKYHKYKIPSVLITLLLAKSVLYISRKKTDNFNVLASAIVSFFTGSKINRFIPGSSVK